MFSNKEKALLCNSLLSLIKACEGRKTQIDLRNESNIYGCIDYVYDDMNVIMSDCVFTNLKGDKKFYKYLTIRGSNIRFVHIPDSIDIINSVQNRINSIRRKKPIRERTRRKPNTNKTN